MKVRATLAADSKKGPLAMRIKATQILYCDALVGNETMPKKKKKRGGRSPQPSFEYGAQYRAEKQACGYRKIKSAAKRKP